MNTLVTGAAGFIGAHVAAALSAVGVPVLGLDDFNAYYDPVLKRARVAALCPGLSLFDIDVGDREAVHALLRASRPDRIVHLAAQAGVRHSLQAPYDYLHANLHGFLNVLEGCRHYGVRHLVYASTSSVYGHATSLPFREELPVATPRNLYAASKGANELMAHAYAELFGFSATGLRFFTVYGPWGRPDMAPFRFARAALLGETVELYNHGRCQRDFTYVDDIVDGVLGALRVPPAAGRHEVYNLGAGAPVDLLDFVQAIERAAGAPLRRKLVAAQPGDMEATFADTGKARAAFGYSPRIDLDTGVGRLVAWLRDWLASADLRQQGGTTERESPARA